MDMTLNREQFIWTISIVVTFVVVGIGVWLLLGGPGAHTPGSVAQTATTTQGTATSSAPFGMPTTTPAQARARTTHPVVPPPTHTAGSVVASGYNSLSYLLGLKEALSCSVNAVAAAGRRTGTVYVSGGMLRANLTSVVNGQSKRVFMIDTGKYVYVWQEATTTGLRAIAASSAAGTAINQEGGIDLSTAFPFSCTAWTPLTDVFSVPSSVTFSPNAS